MTALAIELLLIYLVIGLAIGAAAVVDAARARRPGGAVLAGTGMTAAIFWPLYLPFLLAAARPEDGARALPAGLEPDPAAGALGRALRRTERALDAALGGIEGREALGLAPVLTRIPDVLRILAAQARSVEEIERALAEPGGSAGEDEALDADIARDLARAREESERRLRALHDRRRAELLRALVRLEELVSMVRLARFAREPAGGGGATLIHQIAATVEALAELAADETTSTAT
jgi:hypothetical protein